MKLTVDPLSGLIDEAPRITVEDVPAGHDVVLTIQCTDAAGRAWRSRTDLSGAAGTAESTGLSDPSQPWWRMEFMSEGVAPAAFAAPCDALDYEVTAEAAGERMSLTVSRLWASQVERSESQGQGFRLVAYTPVTGPGPWPGVVVVPGSTGAAAVEPTAALLASRGFATAVLAYMAEPGLPATLEAVPLEALADGIRAFAASSPVDASRLAVVAASVGTGGAFSALAAFADLHVCAVVGISPTSAVWQAIGANGHPAPTSSWALAGEPLPWLPVHGTSVLPQVLEHELLDRFRRHPRPRALRLRASYEPGLRDAEALAAAAIPVERIDAPMLLLAGDDDQMWPATEMARAILLRRNREDDRLITASGSGHFLRPPVTPTTVPWSEDLVSGGDAAGWAAGQAQGWVALRAFLGTHLE